MNVTKHLLVGATLAFTLIGCQGQNPLKRESNPVKDYPNATKATSPYVRGQTQKRETTREEPQRYCEDPIWAGVNGPEESAKVMRFSEGVASPYTVTVVNKRGGKVAIKAEHPKDAQFERIDENGSTATYRFSWAPKYGTSETEVIPTLAISYVGQSECRGTATEFIHLFVKSGKMIPNVEFAGDLDKTLEFGKSVKFSVRITDPLANRNQAPDIKSVSFLNEARNPENRVYDGSKGVDCPDKGKFVSAHTWEFKDCKFDSNLIADIESRLGSGEAIKAVFFVTAVSTADPKNPVESIATPVYIPVLFPKIETAPVQTDQVDEEVFAPKKGAKK